MTENTKPTLRFFWNGIKGSDGKLQRCFIFGGKLTNYPDGTITLTARGCSFSPEVAAHFEIKNDSDSQSDYFEHDRIRVIPTHPLYADVLAALQKCEARRADQHRKKG